MYNLETLKLQIASDEKSYLALEAQIKDTQTIINNNRNKITKLTNEINSCSQSLKKFENELSDLAIKLTNERNELRKLTINIPALNKESFKRLAELIAVAAHEEGTDLTAIPVKVNDNEVSFKLRTERDLDVLYDIFVTSQKKLTCVKMCGNLISFNDIVKLTGIDRNKRALLQNIIYREVLGDLNIIDVPLYDNFVNLAKGNYIALIKSDGVVVKESDPSSSNCNTYEIAVDTLGNKLVVGVPYYTKRDFFRGLFNNNLQTCLKYIKNIEFTFLHIDSILEKYKCTIEGGYIKYET